MNLEKHCRKCGYEIVKEGDVATFFEGKKFCECDKIKCLSIYHKNKDLAKEQMKSFLKDEKIEPSWGWKAYMFLGYRITDGDEDEKLVNDWIEGIRNDAKKEVFDDIKKACIINSDTMFMTTIKNFEEVIEKIRKNHLGDEKKILNMNIHHKNKELAEEQMKSFLKNIVK